jgi:adenylylsulfate kinase
MRVAAQARGARAGAAATPAALPGSAVGAGLHAVGANNAVQGPCLSTTDIGNSTNIRWHDSMVARRDKEMLLGQRGCVLWFTGARCCLP